MPYEDPVIFLLSCRLLTNLLINMEMENQLLFHRQRAASLSGVCNVFWLVISANNLACKHTSYIELYSCTNQHFIYLYFMRERDTKMLDCILQSKNGLHTEFSSIFKHHQLRARTTPDAAALITHNIKCCSSSLSVP